MTYRASARVFQRNPSPKDWALQTTPRPVGGGEAADWAGPDGNQVNATRSPDNHSGSQFHCKRCALDRGTSTASIKHSDIGQLQPGTRAPS